MVEFIDKGLAPRGRKVAGRNHPSANRAIICFVALILFMGLLLSAATPPPPASPVKITRSVSNDRAKNISAWPASSADGNILAFSSLDYLAPEDKNAISDIYIYDHRNRNLTVASLSSEGIPANGASYRPVISADGRHIAFTSLSTNLDPRDTNGLPDVYYRDLITGETLRISSPPDGSPASGWSDQPSLSSDGRYVLFISSATNLVAGVSKPTRRAYIYDTHENLLRPITGVNSETSLASISADGRYVASVVTSDDSTGLYLYDLISATTIPLAPEIKQSNWIQNISQLEISVDGSRLAILVNERRSATIYLYHRQSDQTTRIQAINSLSTSSSDSHFFAFPANGRSLVYIDGKAIRQFDEETGKTRDILRFPNSKLNPSIPAQVAISADGRVLAFQLKAGDATDIYTLDLGDSLGRRSFISGWLINELGTPIAGVEISDGAGHSVRTDAEGNFRFEKVIPGSYTINPIREGVTFSPSNRPISVTLSGVTGLAFEAVPDNIVVEGRKDIGMPYSLNRGCESPFQECGGPFHGFYRGDCTDLVIDAYTEGVKFDIQLALDRDFLSNPRHYYRWRDARNAHDMWRYYAYTGQIISADQPYLPGDIVFFDWELDGVVDHVALVSEVSSKGLPRRILDATGVTTDNPSGLAAELEWRPYHASRTPGHTRWTGIRSSQSRSLINKIPILLVALDSPDISLRLSDSRGRSISANEMKIPGGGYLSTGIGEVISLDQTPMTSQWYFIELSGPDETPYQIGIQIVKAGVVVEHEFHQGLIPSSQPVLIPIRLDSRSDQVELVLP